jgi:hypothetical protein
MGPRFNVPRTRFLDPTIRSMLSMFGKWSAYVGHIKHLNAGAVVGLQRGCARENPSTPKLHLILQGCHRNDVQI